MPGGMRACHQDFAKLSREMVFSGTMPDTAVSKRRKWSVGKCASKAAASV